MNSLKNTVIAVGLLGLSFVFYQMSAPDQSDFKEITPPVVTGLRAELAAASPADQLKLPSLNRSMPIENGNGLRNSLASRKPSEFNLPSRGLTNSLAPPPMHEPKLSPPSLTSPNNTFVTEPPEFKPRPEAKFDFTGKSGPALTPPVGVEQRDQGLINALNQQQNVTNGSQTKTADSFQSNTFVPRAKTPAQPASFMKDSAVVAASSDGLDASDGFNLQPANLPNNDPYSDLNFQTVWPEAEKLVAEKRFRKSLQLLTRFYDSPGLSGPQSQRLDGWLDALATKVIFSAEHHLSPAYVSQPGDSLMELGRKWGVPGQLIYNVNRASLPNPLVIEPGTELKQITGPVNASVDLSSNTMTLFVDGLYAGRFNVIVGTSGSPRPGDFKVVGKLPDGHDWRDTGGVYPPGHPNNHYGRNWIALEGSLCMHSVAAGTNDGHLGCLGLNEKDALDVFSILSEGSTVSIK